VTKPPKEDSVNTPTITADIPTSPSDLYLARRRAHDDHDEAVRKVSHAFQRRPKELAAVLDRARNEHDRQPPLKVGDPAEEIEEVPDEWATTAADIARRITTLRESRATLALDVRKDPSRRQKLSKVEADLRDAEADAECLKLARAEAIRREQRRRDDARREASQAAREDARLLREARTAADAKLAAATTAYAEALADQHDVARRQAEALAASGDGNAWRTTPPLGTVLLGELKTALRAAGAPANWL
jgi:hypothetical protein